VALAQQGGNDMLTPEQKVMLMKLDLQNINILVMYIGTEYFGKMDEVPDEIIDRLANELKIVDQEEKKKKYGYGEYVDIVWTQAVNILKYNARKIHAYCVDNGMKSGFEKLDLDNEEDGIDDL
jgi:hypothetical protein